MSAAFVPLQRRGGCSGTKAALIFRTLMSASGLRRAQHTAPMKLSFLLSLLLPYKRTTEEKARQALMGCGISPDAIAWLATSRLLSTHDRHKWARQVTG